jgi:hypothetical protein
MVVSQSSSASPLPTRLRASLAVLARCSALAQYGRLALRAQPPARAHRTDGPSDLRQPIGRERVANPSRVSPRNPGKGRAAAGLVDSRRARALGDARRHKHRSERSERGAQRGARPESTRASETVPSGTNTPAQRARGLRRRFHRERAHQHREREGFGDGSIGDEHTSTESTRASETGLPSSWSLPSRSMPCERTPFRGGAPTRTRRARTGGCPRAR